MIGVAKTAEGVGNVALTERPEPSAGPGQVVIAVRAAGICGTDLHIEAGEYRCVPPVTMGHECCGTVCEIGEGVDPELVGRLVVTETFASTCGRCRSCIQGRRSRCPERRSIGTHVDGAFAPRVVVPASGVHLVPDGVSDAAASMAEPLACVCHSMCDPPSVDAGDEVLIVGPGAIGLLAAQVARAAGGRVHVRGTPADGSRLELARRLGFETSVATEPFSGNAPDVVVECSGAERGIAAALDLAAPGGTIVQLGLRGHEMTLPYDAICFKELTVRAGFASTPLSWLRAMALIGSSAVALEPLVSGVLALDDFAEGFARSRAADGVKFVLVPG